MKRIIVLLLSALMVLSVLSGCDNKKNNNDNKLKVVTTIFPIYDWVGEVLGDVDVDVEALLNNGVDLHSYQPSIEDIAKINNADVFMYVGGESDEWVEDALKNLDKNVKVINLMEVLGEDVKNEEIVEGMEDEHESGHEHGLESDGHESDKHIWLSLRNAKKCVEAIKDVLCELDPTNMDRYKKNAEEYIEKLELLDQKYMEVVSNSKNNTLIFGDRFPFRYLVDDYNLNYYAAFVGCSTESEASFNTITFLAKKLDELGLTSILTIEGNNHKIAETIIKNTENKNQEILILNSMQGSILEGDTYLSIMEKNLEVLKKALN